MPITLDKNLKALFYDTSSKIREGTAAVLGYGDAMQKAEDVSTGPEFSPGSQYQGEGDAMRHIAFSALATKAYGSDKVPKALSWMNENIKGILDPAEDKDMDLTNDAIGREIGLKAKNEEEVYQMAREAISSGRAKVIKKTPKGDETNEEMEARIQFEKQKSDLDNKSSNSNIREPFESELAYFKKNPSVAGMATEDNKVILNPFSKLSDKEKDAVVVNESARIKMRSKEFKPTFKLTPEQEKFLNSTSYKDASDTDRRATIAARILSGDPSAGKPTKEQLDFVKKLK